ncbi:MAG: peptidoglycan bridge formation protein FemAB [Burkholderiales bacterium RIFCSPLOWO2_12_FULL_61_40]|nr:MAG: peptidoglycan bridge formation protein FemAB [Burkholderiales bacterium RIFCSPLOWO2_12_FULL_61_40]
MLQSFEHSDLTIRRLQPNDMATAVRWDEFVMSHPAATFFHRAGWQRIVRGIFQHDTYFLYAELNGCIQGVLPLGHINSWLFGSSLVGLPFAVYGGVVSNGQHVEKLLEMEAYRIAKHLDVEHVEWRNINPRHADWPVQSLYYTFRKNLLSNDEAIMLAIPRKQRAMVRKGIRNGLKGQIDQDVERFFVLYADNVHRHGTPALPKRYFEALMAEFGADCEIFTVTTSDGLALSGVLSFYFRDEILPYYAGDIESAREMAANDFKYWELMRRASERGVKVFDFGRSKLGSGSYAFKRNWGFEPTPLHYEYCLYKRNAIPQNNPSNSKYKLLISTWRRLPLGLANWLGPFIVRNLG